MWRKCIGGGFTVNPQRVIKEGILILTVLLCVAATVVISQDGGQGGQVDAATQFGTVEADGYTIDTSNLDGFEIFTSTSVEAIKGRISVSDDTGDPVEFSIQFDGTGLSEGINQILVYL